MKKEFKTIHDVSSADIGDEILRLTDDVKYIKELYRSEKYSEIQFLLSRTSKVIETMEGLEWIIEDDVFLENFLIEKGNRTVLIICRQHYQLEVEKGLNHVLLEKNTSEYLLYRNALAQLLMLSASNLDNKFFYHKFRACQDLLDEEIVRFLRENIRKISLKIYLYFYEKKFRKARERKC